jgi:hypothetical protein
MSSIYPIKRVNVVCVESLDFITFEINCWKPKVWRITFRVGRINFRFRSLYVAVNYPFVLFLSAIVKSYSPLMSLLLMSFTTYFEP